MNVTAVVSTIDDTFLSTTLSMGTRAISVRLPASIVRYVFTVEVPKSSSSLTAAMSSRERDTVTTVAATSAVSTSPSVSLRRVPDCMASEWSSRPDTLRLATITGSSKVSEILSNCKSIL